MPDIVTSRIDHPVAWRGSDFASPDALSVALSPVQREGLVSLGRTVHAQGRAWSDLTPEEKALPDLAGTLAAVRREVYEGRGVVLLRGLPMDVLDEDEAAIVAWAICFRRSTKASACTGSASLRHPARP